MEIIREIYQDYEIIINSTACKSEKIEMEIIVTPYIVFTTDYYSIFYT